MASRTRGQTVKADVLTPILRQIPTQTLILPRLEPLYYAILEQLQFPEFVYQDANLNCRINQSQS